ncbi:MAG: hypothetical protein V4858_13845 [Pseudomonadota bacterium]
MKLYSLFLLMATATVFSPGPGVVKTLTSERGGRALNKTAGATFVFFGAALATAKRLCILKANLSP